MRAVLLAAAAALGVSIAPPAAAHSSGQRIEQPLEVVLGAQYGGAVHESSAVRAAFEAAALSAMAPLVGAHGADAAASAGAWGLRRR